MAERQIAMLPRHRTAKGARRLQDLTDVAAELFLERGFESVAVDDLIARVGGSSRNVYSHPDSSKGREVFFADRYERQVLDGVGHFPQREAPQAVAEAVSRFCALV